MRISAIGLSRLQESGKRGKLLLSKCGLSILPFNPLNAELNPICYLLALLGAHHFLHVSRIRVKSLTLMLTKLNSVALVREQTIPTERPLPVGERLLMSYIYIYGAPILDVSRSHTTTHHSR